MAETLGLIVDLPLALAGFAESDTTGGGGGSLAGLIERRRAEALNQGLGRAQLA